MSRKRPKKARTPPPDLSLPLEALTFVVSPEEDGERVDRFLMARLTWRSRASIVELLEEGKVRRNDQPLSKKSVRLRAGDRLAVAVPPPEEEIRHEELGLQLFERVLHDDEHMLALAKPPDMVMHPVGRVRANTLIQVVHWMVLHGPLSAGERSPERIPRICHRLDRDTSGVVVLAKTPAARTALQHAFDVHELEKDYLAVVRGRPLADSGRIDEPIGPDDEADTGVKMKIRADGAPSLTTYQVLQRFAPATSVRFRIHTGRQHQIRVHAQSIGHPVLLDALYGEGAGGWPADGRVPVIARQALHAERLALAHPISGAPLELRAEVPGDMQALLSALAP